MPNVPNVPGVPPLNSYLAETFTLLSSDLLSALGIIASQQWGLFLNGVLAITAESVNSFEYNQEWAIASYPIEQGGFESYDKVYTPFSIRIRFVSGGSFVNREALLSDVAAIAGDLNLYDAVTPEQVYLGVNVEGYNYTRQAQRGLGLMIIDMHLVQINESGAAAFSQTQNPGSQNSQNNGQNQTTPTTPAQTQDLSAVQ